jgi:hypothetical protein
VKLRGLVVAGLATDIVRTLDGRQLAVLLGAAVLVVVVVVCAGLWAAKHTDINEWTPWQWKRGPSAAPQPQQPKAPVKKPSGTRRRACQRDR